LFQVLTDEAKRRCPSSQGQATHKDNCSCRLTWVRLCARLCPSARDTFLLEICEHLQRSGQMGALAAVCTPTLKLANKKHQNSTPPYRSTVDGTLKVVKGIVCCVSFSGSGKQSFSSPLCVTSRLEQATRVCSGENLPKVRSPFPTSKVPFKRL